MPMDSASTAKRQDFNAPEKSKTASKYKHIFSTNELLLHTYYGIASEFMIWSYGISSDFNHSCFLALENGCVAKVVKFQ